MLKLTT